MIHSCHQSLSFFTCWLLHLTLSLVYAGLNPNLRRCRIFCCLYYVQFGRFQYDSARCFSGEDSVQRLYRGWYLHVVNNSKNLVNMLEYSFSTQTVGNSGITIKRHPILDFALHSKWYSNEKLNHSLYWLVHSFLRPKSIHYSLSLCAISI